MPHNSRHSGSTGDDLCSTDEVKVFKDEGDRDDEKISTENLLVEEKSSLIDLTECEEKHAKQITLLDRCAKIDPHNSINMGYIVSPYTYGNDSSSNLPVSMGSKINLSPFFCNNASSLTTPPPAHCGIPPYHLETKSISLARPALYSFTHGQYPYAMLNPDISQIASWHTPSVYSAASTFRNSYPATLTINSSLSNNFPFRLTSNLLPSIHASQQHVLPSQTTLTNSCEVKQSSQNLSTQSYTGNVNAKSKSASQGSSRKNNSDIKKPPHIKKPLNAFMIYMKEMRAKVVAECSLKESAAINQILGRKWHQLTREEQSKYYEKARQERQLHMELYPGWSARNNYGYVAKKPKKKKRNRSPTDLGDHGCDKIKCSDNSS